MYVCVWVTQSCPNLCNPMNWGFLYPWNFPGKNTRVGSHSLLQGIFLTHGSNSGPLHCKQIFYHLSHKGSPGRSQLGAIFTWQFWRYFWLLKFRVREVLLELNEWRPEMLLNTPQCQDSPLQRRIVQPQMSIVLGFTKCWFIEYECCISYNLSNFLNNLDT